MRVAPAQIASRMLRLSMASAFTLTLAYSASNAAPARPREPSRLTSPEMSPQISLADSWRQRSPTISGLSPISMSSPVSISLAHSSSTLPSTGHPPCQSRRGASLRHGTPRDGVRRARRNKRPRRRERHLSRLLFLRRADRNCYSRLCLRPVRLDRLHRMHRLIRKVRGPALRRSSRMVLTFCCGPLI